MVKRCNLDETYWIEANLEFQHDYHHFSIVILLLRAMRIVSVVYSDAGAF